MSLTQTYVQSLFSYDPDLGTLVRKSTRAGNAMLGTEAGWVSEYGYKRLRIDNKDYLTHRIIWLYVHGYFPEYEIDHINGDRLDNRLYDQFARSR